MKTSLRDIPGLGDRNRMVESLPCSPVLRRGLVGPFGGSVVGSVSGPVRLDRGIDRIAISYELANRVGKLTGAAASGVVEVESAAGRQDLQPCGGVLQVTAWRRGLDQEASAAI
jgi:hypothetical protein